MHSNPSAPTGHALNGPVAPFVPYTRAPKLEEVLDRYLGQGCPVRLPEAHREGFVRWSPWVAVAFLPLHASSLLVLLALDVVLSLLGHPFQLIHALLEVVAFAFAIAAVPGLFRRSRAGFACWFYSLVVGAAGSLLSLSLSSLFFTVLVLWLTFQVKALYR